MDKEFKARQKKAPPSKVAEIVEKMHKGVKP